ncbi:glycerophosphodiester phosphodiesterase family protein [Marinimicrobium sp. C6131]|uniref:glycerophosphodiester phosphodiesterase n=1 Tax=Marinimicrobium sp. C6131 TaxID=3022676 RepID=UPI00223E4FCE|nr:glycerophosphodiester phosphodiesterase family protein [Marinimicrobium sp. C6131]UZJ42992.1 glycerophosphodiester phosphodiesterase family protein [Marinimicrobium sp. C6131]
MSAPLWISHRGLCERATENTADAFRAALDAGFSHLETDLRSTADGHLVLAHDEDLTRIAGLDLKVTEATRAELEQVRLKGGEPLLFFDEWLEEFGQHRWILDIKPEHGERTLALLLKHWQGEGKALLSGRARFLFWDPRQQKLLLDQQPEIECMVPMPACRRAGLACVAGLPPLAGIRPGATYSLPARLAGVRLLRPAMVDRYQRRQGRVLAFLPESGREVDWALESGVDEILTNYRPG